MANHISDILSIWFPLKDEQKWVLASIIETEGSSYRKAGAVMLINDLGQYYGLLSGGCLESDIMRHARHCLQAEKDKIIEYDMRDDADLAWQLGLGCGGRVKILLQPLSQNNHYLHLPELLKSLEEGKKQYYFHDLTGSSGNRVSDYPPNALPSNNLFFVSQHQPQVELAVFGGGVDARPLVAMAVNMGWKVYLIDHRTAYAREAYFGGCEAIIRTPSDELKNASWLTRIHAAVVMTHNVELDAKALSLLEYSAVQYTGLLGPTHRTEKVFGAMAKTESSNYSKPLWNPMGLALGGELPESIALSTLAEIHQVIFKGSGGSISGDSPASTAEPNKPAQKESACES